MRAAAALLVALSVSAAAPVALGAAAPATRPGGPAGRDATESPGLVPDGAWWSARAVAHAGGMSLDAAVAAVQRRYNAKVVRADEARDGEDVVYRIRCLSSDGRVFTVTVNARTGQMD